MMELDKAALDRWITREPDWFEDEEEGDRFDIPEECEGCGWVPCCCHVPQSERWEGR